MNNPHCLADCYVNVLGKADHVRQRFNIAGGDAATVRPQDASGEGDVLALFSVTGRRRFGVKLLLTVFWTGQGWVCSGLGWPGLAVMVAPGRWLVASHLVGFTR